MANSMLCTIGLLGTAAVLASTSCTKSQRKTSRAPKTGNATSGAGEVASKASSGGLVTPEMKVTLPKARSATPVPKFPVLVLGRENIFLDGKPVAPLEEGRVPARLKPEGADGFLIDPLYSRLKKLARDRKRTGKMAGMGAWRPGLVIVADAETPYRLFVEALYTAAQAGYVTFGMGVRRPDGTEAVVPCGAPRIGRIATHFQATFSHFVSRGGVSGAMATRAIQALQEMLTRVAATPHPSFSPGVIGMSPKSPSHGNRSHGPNSTVQPLHCRQKLPAGGQVDIGVVLTIDRKGRVDKLAAKGGSPAIVECCIKPWAAQLQVDPSQVPAGTYGFVVHLGGTNPGAAALPEPQELVPLVRPVEKCVDLLLTMVLTRKGYYLKSRFGSECHNPDEPDERLCGSWEGKSGEEVFSELSKLLYHVYAEKYRAPRFWSHDPRKRAHITIVPTGEVPVQRVIQAIEAARHAPSAKGAGCRMVLDTKTGSWAVAGSAQNACMYPYVTLAIGS